MIDEKLGEILEKYYLSASSLKLAKGEIKALVIESLGKEKPTTDIEITIETESSINYGRNQHIAKMKKIWK